MVRYENIMDYGEMMLEFISIREQVPSKTSHERVSWDILQDH